MNSYYHGFEVGFNFWMIYAVVMVGVMVVLGLKQYRRSRRQAVQVFNDQQFAKVALVAGAVLLVWLIIESGDGIIQMLDNGLPGDEYAWQSVVAMPFVALCIAAVFAVLLYVIGWVAGLAKLGHLHRELEGWQHEWAERKVRRMAKWGDRYKLADATYVRSVTVLQGVEQKGNQTRRMRVICDQDWTQVNAPLQPELQTIAQKRPKQRLNRR